MNINTLSVIVTISGIIFFAISLAIIILGKKVGDSNNPQYIKLKGIEIKTNSVVTLLIITAVISLTPIGLSYWKPGLDDYVSRKTIETDYIPLEGLSLTIRGNVIDERGWADDVKIKVSRSLGEISSVTDSETDQMGFFVIDLANVKPKERYELYLKKEGYDDILFKFGFLEINTQYKLSKVDR